MTGGRVKRSTGDLGLPSSEKTGDFRRVVDVRKTGGRGLCQGTLFPSDMVKIPPWSGQHGGAPARAGVSKVEDRLCFLYECPRPWFQVTEQCM